MSIREFRPGPNNDLVTSEGDSVFEVEKVKRDTLAQRVHEKRQERDALNQKAGSIKTKIRSFFGGESPSIFKQKAGIIQEGIPREISIGKSRIDTEREKLVRDTMEATVSRPLYDLSSMYHRHAGFYGHVTEKDALDFKIGQEELKQSFRIENLKTAFLSPELRDEVLSPIARMFSSDSVYQGVTRVQPYIDSPSVSEGLPVDIAEVVMKSICSEYQRGNAVLTDKPRMLMDLLNNAYPLGGSRLSDAEKKSLGAYVSDHLTDLPIKDISNLRNLLELGLSLDNEGVFKQKIQKAIDGVFESEQFSGFNNLCASGNELVSSYAKEKLNEYLKSTFEIQLADVEYAWLQGQLEHDDVFKNIYAMKRLEGERPGVVKELLVRFGIKEFGRYPKEALISQYDERDSNLPYGAIAVTNCDYNISFDMDERVYQKIFDQTKGRIAMRFTEFASRRELYLQLSKLNREYGDLHKMEYLILGAHGSSYGFGAGKGGDVEMKTLDGAQVIEMKDFFIENPNIILFSCSTGAEGGFGQKASEVYGARVVAPAVPSSVTDAEVTFDTNSHPQIEVTYMEGGQNVARKYQKGKALPTV